MSVTDQPTSGGSGAARAALDVELHEPADLPAGPAGSTRNPAAGRRAPGAARVLPELPLRVRMACLGAAGGAAWAIKLIVDALAAAQAQ